jgi:glycerate 2-kinase
MDTNYFSPSLLGDPQRAKVVQRILAAALRAADPEAAVRRYVGLSGDSLKIGSGIYPFNEVTRVLVVGAGKASPRMAAAVESILQDRITTGVVIAKGEKHPATTPLGKIRILSGAHPVPDKTSLESTQDLLALLDDVNELDLVICLISGGGSALLTAPVPGVKLLDLQALTGELLACGAAIQEINVLRKHLDQVKGGGLLRAVAPAKIVSLILSDVVGDALDAIASGPTAPDGSTYMEALDILRRYKLERHIPASILNFLREGAAGEHPETVKGGDVLLERARNLIIGSNRLAAQAALDQAIREGFNTLLWVEPLQGEARQAGMMLGDMLRLIVHSGVPLARPACLVAGGETTVTLRGGGKGGRNQETALAATTCLDGLDDVALVTLATDGEDGPTDAAGAVVTGDTFRRAAGLGLDPAISLTRNDSYPFFEQLNAHVHTGVTGTNVNDLAFLFAF